MNTQGVTLAPMRKEPGHLLPGSSSSLIPESLRAQGHRAGSFRACDQGSQDPQDPSCLERFAGPLEQLGVPSYTHHNSCPAKGL